MHRNSRSTTQPLRTPARLRLGGLVLAGAIMLLGAMTEMSAGAQGGETHPGAATHGDLPRPAGLPTTSFTAQLSRRTQLRSRPGGPVVTTLGKFTKFGTDRVMAVVARRGDWLGVLSESMPTSRAGWIPAASVKLRHTRYELDVDRSERRLTVRRDGRVMRRFSVAVGRPGLETPLGRFAVTDTLIMGGGPYGCCVMPITGVQSALPAAQGRLAIHGTDDEASIGTAASSGCVRARSTDMRWLLNRVTPGTVLRVRA